MKIGQKSNQNPGYVWCPYIMTQSVAVVSESNLTSKYLQAVASRYGTIILSKSHGRIKKAKKILEKIEDLKSNQK